MNTIMKFEEAMKLAKTESQRVVLGYISRVLERMPEGSKMSGEVFVCDDKGAALVVVAPAGGRMFGVCSTKEGVEVAPVGDERRSMFLDSKRMNSDFAGDFIVDYMTSYKK